MRRSRTYKTKLALTALFVSLAVSGVAQGVSYYEDSQFDPFQRQTYMLRNACNAENLRVHSAIRSYDLRELGECMNLDSLIYDGIRLPEKKMNIWRRFLYDDLLLWRTENIYVAINPMLDLSLGKDGDRKTFVNSRGFYINGNLGQNFWFYMDFSENQARYPSYVTDNDNYMVPGQANYHYEGVPVDPDFEVSNGYIGFNVGPYVDFQIGKTKTFIGDGYRSLLLSDAACAYPMLKCNVKFMGVKYMLMMAQLRTTDSQGTVNNGLRVKYSFTHYFDFNVCRRFSFGIFENVTQAAWRLTGESRSVDWDYVCPLVILRAGEFNAGSPDKMLVGLNTKFIAANWLTLYGQLMFNEFRLKELTSDRKYWSNKYGFLGGLRLTDLFNVPGLDGQLEYSQVRPFCYSQYDGMGTYTHHGESLAHPLGANFREAVGILKYKHKRLALRAQMNYAQYGEDIPGDEKSYGHNPDVASSNRNATYGVLMLQGAKTTLKYTDVAASFIINPRCMMNITAGCRLRSLQSEYESDASHHFYVALRWSLKQHYFDF